MVSNLKVSEHELQAAFFAWVRWRSNNDDRFKNIFAIPNAGKRSFGALAYYKAEGLESGVPDVFVAIPRSYPIGMFLHGLFMEFKRPRQRPTAEQLKWKYRLRDAGYVYEVVSSVEGAQQRLLDWFDLKE